MKTRSKALLLSLCAILLVASTVFGTLAYLTDTDKAINTFTVGDVQIKLDEAKVTEDGAKVDPEERVQENKYHLLPGHSYAKDPTVTVLSGSEESYVRMMVTVDFGVKLDEAWLATDLGPIFTGFDENNWTRFKQDITQGENSTKIVYEYRYNTTVKGETTNEEGAAVAGDNKLPALFTEIKIPGEWTNEQIALFQNMTITVEANAIQAKLTNELSNADAAWAAFDEQNAGE